MILFEMFTQRFVMIMLVLAANPAVLRPWIRCKSRNGDLISEVIDIMGWNTSTVYEAYTRLEREAARIGLLMNATKTKYLRRYSNKRQRACSFRVAHTPGHSGDQGVWRRRMNHELAELYGESDILTVASRKRPNGSKPL